ncbi:unnamed protein product [Macrosiphum euphorbiae]|uniref:Uncharacterized protein n=1 Tax=Macrosiphum euphorbiae TaxID=13131 RepID=A0AAV0XSL2_9HEMI|nr:unnamed protein product [Macrosiphum euphorbiae]
MDHLKRRTGIPDVSDDIPVSPSSQKFRKTLQESGYQEQLPTDHPLLKLYRRSLSLSHGDESSAAKNYTANVAKMLYFVDAWLKDRKTPAKHWSQLLGTSEEPFREYLSKREELGQTIATSINYLKNLNALYELALSCYCLEDPSFPQSFDSTPCPSRINAIKVVKQKLKLIYKNKIKNQPQELFNRKTEEARTVPEYLEVYQIIKRISESIPKTLTQLEEHVGEEGPVDVSTYRDSAPIQKHLSTLWRSVSCGLALTCLWISKHRSGVVTNCTVAEFENRKKEGSKIIITVSKHKTGDKEPAMMVFDQDDTAAHLERYYKLRTRVRTSVKEHDEDITSRGKRLTKLYEEINRIYKCQLSANIFRRMVETQSRALGKETMSGIATALQHSESTALRYYQLPDSNEALRRQTTIDTVDATAVFESLVEDEFPEVFNPSPYIDVSNGDTVRKNLEKTEARSNPLASVSDQIIIRYQLWFTEYMMDERVDVTVGLLKGKSMRDVTKVLKSEGLSFFLRMNSKEFLTKVEKKLSRSPPAQ